MSTLAELIIEAEKKLRLVSGTAVQTYAEEALMQNLKTMFKKVFEARFWEDYTSTQTFTLDGTLGIPNADIATTILSRFQDIQYIFAGGTNRPLKRLPKNMNPNLLSGSSPVFFDSYMATDPDRVFQVFPAASTGTVVVRCRAMPTLDDDTIVPDSWDETLYLYAAWKMAETDGTNPAGIASLADEWKQAYEDLLTTFREVGAVDVTGVRYPTGLTDWA